MGVPRSPNRTSGETVFLQTWQNPHRTDRLILQLGMEALWSPSQHSCLLSRLYLLLCTSSETHQIHHASCQQGARIHLDQQSEPAQQKCAERGQAGKETALFWWRQPATSPWVYCFHSNLLLTSADEHLQSWLWPPCGDGPASSCHVCPFLGRHQTASLSAKGNI